MHLYTLQCDNSYNYIYSYKTTNDNLFLFDTDADNINIKANTSLKELNTWFDINKLSLNIEKTCYMLFSSAPKNCIKLVLNDIDIQKVHMCKYLGLYFDDQLTWRFHIDYVYLIVN